MRRFASALLAVPLLLLLVVGPVLADTTPGGSGTNFFSSTTTCSPSGGREVCTDTILSVGPNESGTPETCLDVFTYSYSSSGRFTFISDRNGCTPTGSNLTVGSNFSVTLAPTDITMRTCAAHKRLCSGATNATVSAHDTVSGAVTTATTRSTSVSGNCTTKSTTTETSAELSGTITIDGSSVDEQGFLDIFKVTSTTRCR
jgi:hypothetical protein